MEPFSAWALAQLPTNGHSAHPSEMSMLISVLSTFHRRWAYVGSVSVGGWFVHDFRYQAYPLIDQAVHQPSSNRSHWLLRQLRITAGWWFTLHPRHLRDAAGDDCDSKLIQPHTIILPIHGLRKTMCFFFFLRFLGPLRREMAPSP